MALFDHMAFKWGHPGHHMPLEESFTNIFDLYDSNGGVATIRLQHGDLGTVQGQKYMFHVQRLGEFFHQLSDNTLVSEKVLKFSEAHYNAYRDKLVNPYVIHKFDRIYHSQAHGHMQNHVDVQHQAHNHMQNHQQHQANFEEAHLHNQRHCESALKIKDSEIHQLQEKEKALDHEATVLKDQLHEKIGLIQSYAQRMMHLKGLFKSNEDELVKLRHENESLRNSHSPTKINIQYEHLLEEYNTLKSLFEELNKKFEAVKILNAHMKVLIARNGHPNEIHHTNVHPVQGTIFREDPQRTTSRMFGRSKL